MQRKRKIILALVFLGVVIVAASSYTAIQAISAAKQLGINATSTGEKAEILATVGQYSISTLDVQGYKINLKLQEVYVETVNATQKISSMTDAQILVRLVENTVLFLEAEKQGLLIADSDVDQYIVTMKEVAKNDNSPELTLIREYASGRGLTLDEYFDSNKPLYKKLMSIGNLRSKYVAGIASFAEETAKWQQVKTELVKNYQSQIHIVG